MNFTDLKIWQKSHQLTLEIYKLTQQLPKTETFGIVSQIQRSASSVPANIAEGFGRKSKNEFIQFLYQAKGSLVETQYFLILIKDLKYSNITSMEKLISQYEELAKMLNSFITHIKLKWNHLKL